MGAIERVYQRSPVFVQNAFATAYGLKERRLRYSGEFKQYYAELKQSEWWPRERLEEHQRRALSDLLRFCAERVPYYRHLLREADIDLDLVTVGDLERLPLLEKEQLRRDPDRFVASPAPGRLVTQTTGGTTGTPLRYKVTPAAVRYNYATYEARLRDWADVPFGRRMATISGKVVVPMGTTGPPFWRMNFAFNQLYLSAYHLSTENLPSYVARLRRFRPELIVGYTSAVHAIARFMVENGLAGDVAPRAVIVSSETLFDHARVDIETAFACKVFDAYGLGELTAFISECPAGSKHVSPEYGVVEVVGSRDGAGEIIATGLRNYGMPLIRYRTGDLCVPAFDRTCACGRELPIVERIVGRVDDTLVTAGGASVGAAAMSLVFQGVPNLREGQIHQMANGNLTVHVVVTPAFTVEHEAALRRELRKRLGDLTIEIARVDAIERTSGGKQRVIVRHG